MLIKPSWRVLTVGDGDLSFSYALLKKFSPRLLTATTLDQADQILEKYSSSNFLHALQREKVTTFNGFDVTQADSWQNIKAEYDLVIFQFPLIPAYLDQQDFESKRHQLPNSNIANRHLLRQFLFNCFEHFLDKKGQRLAYISSKDVKPYCQWDIERALTLNSEINYLGSFDFDKALFNEYQLRNVNRDKKIKDTQGTTYVWSDKSTQQITSTGDMRTWLNSLQPLQHNNANCCPLCKAGPFTTEHDFKMHTATKKHQLLADYEKQWLQFLDKTEQ